MLEDDYVAGNPELNGSDKLVVLSGCSGGGKSSLLSEMASRGYAVQPEAGRQVVKEQQFIGGDALPWDNIEKFVELSVSRAMFHYNTACLALLPTFFDRCIVDTISALARLGLTTPGYLSTALRRYRYSPKVFLTPPWPELFSQDSERQHGFDAAKAEYEGLLSAYPAHGYEVIVIPKIGVAQRADFLEEQLSLGE